MSRSYTEIMEAAHSVLNNSEINKHKKAEVLARLALEMSESSLHASDLLAKLSLTYATLPDFWDPSRI